MEIPSELHFPIILMFMVLILLSILMKVFKKEYFLPISRGKFSMKDHLIMIPSILPENGSEDPCGELILLMKFR